MMSGDATVPSQFLRELHFIEACAGRTVRPSPPLSQFLRELHFIEACAAGQRLMTTWVAVPSGTALH